MDSSAHLVPRATIAAMPHRFRGHRGGVRSLRRVRRQGAARQRRHRAGRVAAESSTKPVQHLEGGIVREILVKILQVTEGQVLFRLERREARANADMLKKQIDAALAMEARLLAERDGAATLEFPAALVARRSVPETAAALSDQEKRFKRRRLLEASSPSSRRASTRRRRSSAARNARRPPTRTRSPA